MSSNTLNKSLLKDDAHNLKSSHSTIFTILKHKEKIVNLLKNGK